MIDIMLHKYVYIHVRVSIYKIGVLVVLVALTGNPFTLLVALLTALRAALSVRLSPWCSPWLSSQSAPRAALRVAPHTHATFHHKHTQVLLGLVAYPLL